MKKKPQKVNKTASITPPLKKKLPRKNFKENPLVEQFYRSVQEYSLREEAYKAALQIYINLKK